MRLSSATAVALVFATVTASAAETSSSIELAWNAPSGCPSVESVLDQARRGVGDVTAHRVTARADVTELGPERWTVHLVTEVDGVAGERSLEANSCASLASATALILAWTVDPTRAPSSAPPGATTTEMGHSGDARPTTVPSPGSTLRAFLAVGAAVDIGTLPKPAVGGELALGGLLGPLRAELTGVDWFAQDASGGSGGTRIHLLEGAFLACLRGPIGARFELDPCVGGGLVHASSDGFGLAHPYQETSTWGTIRGDVLAVWSLAGPLALRASVGFMTPLVRPSFVILDPQRNELPLHRAAPVAARGLIGAEVHFP
jgi:hypothetical protein